MVFDTQKFLPDALAARPLQDFPALLRQMQAQSAAVQEAVLLDILRRAQETQIGKKYGFAQLDGAAAFRARVPVTEYADYEVYMEPLRQGAADVLFPGAAASFSITTGTTGTPKLIPESGQGALVQALVGNVRTAELLRILPAIMQPQVKVLPIVNAAVFTKTEGGVPVGASSGKAVGASALAAKSVFPAAALALGEMSTEAMDYLTLLCGVRERCVGGLVCNNLLHFKRLLDRLNGDPAPVLCDIREGTISADLPERARALLQETLRPDAARADELEALYRKRGALTVGDLWPDFLGVCCWTSGSVGRGVRELRGIFPQGTVFVDWGYGASEGKFNIPFAPGSAAGYPSVFGYFFEFLPLSGGEPLLLEETEAGEKYELLLTSYSGYYRYNIHDIVKIGEDEHGWKTMEFYCKSAECLVLGGKRFYGGRLLELTCAYEDSTGDSLTLCQGRAAGDALDLVVEPAAADWKPEALRAFMEDALAREGIRLGHIEEKPQGYRDSLFGLHVNLGKTVNQTKLPVFVKS